MAKNTRGDNKKAAGIREIAVALGVSIGTVDRALHNRPRIHAETQARVLEMARKLGYRPNIAARHLRLNRKLKISVHLPLEIASFFDSVREGIQEAALPFASTIEMQFRSYPRLGVGDMEVFKEALREQVNGIIHVPGHPSVLKAWAAKAAKNKIPVVYVATDAPETERLSSIACDPYTSGALAAELLTRCGRGSGAVLVATGDLTTHDHAEKLHGFKQTLFQMKSALDPVLVIEARDDSGQAYRKANSALKQHQNIRAVYVSTANSLPVIHALEEAGRAGEIAIVTTDLFPALIPLIRSGKVLGTIYQRPRAQGRMAFQFLYQSMVEQTAPAARYHLSPYIVLQSNLGAQADLLAENS